MTFVLGDHAIAGENAVDHYPLRIPLPPTDDEALRTARRAILDSFGMEYREGADGGGHIGPLALRRDIYINPNATPLSRGRTRVGLCVLLSLRLKSCCARSPGRVSQAGPPLLCVFPILGTWLP